MATSRLVYLFAICIVCSFQYVSCTGQVPVIIWGDLERTSHKSNPLTDINEYELDAILKQELQHEPFTVVFIEESLSVEDFSRKNANGEGSYPYLHANIADSLYLPAVESSVAVLNKLADPEKVDYVKLTENGLSAEIEPEGGKFLFVTLKDAREGESRADMLRRHNNFMENMFNKLQKRFDKVVGVYTANYPSWIVSEHSRIRRQASDVSADDEAVFRLDNVLLYVKNLTLKDTNNEIQLSGMTSSKTVRNDTLNTMETTIAFGDNTIKIYFTMAGGYWYLSKADIEEKDKPIETVETSDVYAVDGFSYRCAQAVTFTTFNSTKNTMLIFEDMQIQPFFSSNHSSFGDPYYCVGFTSVPIWAGLFVVFILLSIMFYGVMMMMDIRTMDRFDDPKGKTITINAGE